MAVGSGNSAKTFFPSLSRLAIISPGKLEADVTRLFETRTFLSEWFFFAKLMGRGIKKRVFGVGLSGKHLFFLIFFN